MGGKDPGIKAKVETRGPRNYHHVVVGVQGPESISVCTTNVSDPHGSAMSGLACIWFLVPFGLQDSDPVAVKLEKNEQFF
jgi:hypothetical protein